MTRVAHPSTAVAAAARSAAEPRRRLASLVAVVAVAALVAGCSQNARPLGTSPLSYKDRHPISIGHYPVSIEVAADPHLGMLTPKGRNEVYGFVRAYANEGESHLQVFTPSGGSNESTAHAIVGEIRKIAADEGIPHSVLSVRPYHAADGLGPVRLTYSRLRAVAPDCGFWPSDISGDRQNRDYENFGCASQQSLAAIVADPRDLLGPRGSIPRDSERRGDMFEKWRTAQDPSTQYGDSGEATASDVGQ